MKNCQQSWCLTIWKSACVITMYRYANYTELHTNYICIRVIKFAWVSHLHPWGSNSRMFLLSQNTVALFIVTNMRRHKRSNIICHFYCYCRLSPCWHDTKVHTHAHTHTYLNTEMEGNWNFNDWNFPWHL